MDEGKLRVQQDRGQRAKSLIDNTLLQEAFSDIEKALMQSWKNSQAGDELGREDVWRSVQLLNNLQEGIKRHVITGETAGKQLLQIQEKSKLRKVLNV